jgi:hypothetical protein
VVRDRTWHTEQKKQTVDVELVQLRTDVRLLLAVGEEHGPDRVQDPRHLLLEPRRKVRAVHLARLAVRLVQHVPIVHAERRGLARGGQRGEVGGRRRRKVDEPAGS